MLNAPIVDLAIALSFTYFVLSLIVSTVHEFIFSVLSTKRADFLKKTIQDFFFDDKWKPVANRLLENIHIQSLVASRKRCPSYIPAKNFALALLDQFRKDHSLLTMNDIREVLLDDEQAKKKGIEGDIRKALLSLFERADGDLKIFQRQIEDYYNNVMERASGAYKRSAQKAIFIISFILATALNADTIHIAQTFWGDKTMLKQTADNIQMILPEIEKDSAGNFILNDSLQLSGDRSLSSTDSSATLKQTAGQIKQTVAYAQSAGIPLGWTNFNNIPHGLAGWLIKLFGLLLTTSALMLGAPFWFDLINKIINARATGKKPQNNDNNTQTSSQNAVG